MRPMRPWLLRQTDAVERLDLMSRGYDPFTPAYRAKLRRPMTRRMRRQFVAGERRGKAQ